MERVATRRFWVVVSKRQLFESSGIGFENRQAAIDEARRLAAAVTGYALTQGSEWQELESGA